MIVYAMLCFLCLELIWGVKRRNVRSCHCRQQIRKLVHSRYIFLHEIIIVRLWLWLCYKAICHNAPYHFEIIQAKPKFIMHACNCQTFNLVNKGTNDNFRSGDAMVISSVAHAADTGVKV